MHQMFSQPQQKQIWLHFSKPIMLDDPVKHLPNICIMDLKVQHSTSTFLSAGAPTDVCNMHVYNPSELFL